MVLWTRTVDIALALVCLHDKQICDMAPNMILVAGRITAEYLLQAASS